MVRVIFTENHRLENIAFSESRAFKTLGTSDGPTEPSPSAGTSEALSLTLSQHSEPGESLPFILGAQHKAPGSWGELCQAGSRDHRITGSQG